MKMHTGRTVVMVAVALAIAVAAARSFWWRDARDIHRRLDGLADRDDPLVARLDRQPGRKEARYGQLLAGGGQARAEQPPDQADVPDGLTLAGLSREVELLRAEVARLRTQVDGLRHGVEAG